MPRETTRVPFEIRNELLKKEVQFIENKEREKNEVSGCMVFIFCQFFTKFFTKLIKGKKPFCVFSLKLLKFDARNFSKYKIHDKVYSSKICKILKLPECFPTKVG